jgi:hypothetical protein
MWKAEVKLGVQPHLLGAGFAVGDQGADGVGILLEGIRAGIDLRREDFL